MLDCPNREFHKLHKNYTRSIVSYILVPQSFYSIRNKDFLLIKYFVFFPIYRVKAAVPIGKKPESDKKEN